MKIVYTLVMVIAIQVIAVSQTHNKLVPTVKRNSVKSESKVGEPAKEMQLEFFTQKIEELNKQIEKLETLKGKVNEEINQFFVSKNIPAFSGDQIIPTTTGVPLAKNENHNINDLMKDVDELTAKSTELRTEARKANGELKKQLNAKSEEFLEKALLKQIEASELSYLVSKEKYDANKEQLALLLLENQNKPYACARVNALVTQAAYAMQMAKEIRDEAKLLLDFSAKLGSYGNAEENEHTALAKQEEALSYFSGSYYAANRNKF